ISVTVTSSVRSQRNSPPQHGHWVIVTGTGCGGSLVAAAAGALRKVKGPLPALRPDRLRFFFRLDWPCDFFPRPAAFSSLRSCSFSRRSRSISSCDFAQSIAQDTNLCLPFLQLLSYVTTTRGAF